jgi:type II secretory pathway pseudopilin PulG
MELIAAVIVIGILTSLAIANYTSAKEKTLNKEAFSSLKMLRVAEKSYYMDYRSYYSSTDMTAINNNLKVYLVTGSKRNWDYTVYSSGCSQAIRSNDPARKWYLTIANDGDPVAGNCP